MTALEACDAIEKSINVLHDETRETTWEISYTVPHTDEEHLQNYKESLEKTRKHFVMDDSVPMWFVSTPKHAILALCGNSPTAEARANYIAWVNPTNMELLIARLRELEEMNAAYQADQYIKSENAKIRAEAK